MAIRALIGLGCGDDERVIAACDNFVELREKYSGWCDTNIREGLVAEARRAKARR